MGLGINIQGKIKKPLLAFKKESLDTKRLQDQIVRCSSGVFKDFLFFEQNENILYATLHPCEEPVNFELTDDIINCSAKTNSVGPGYHAYLVELIEKLGEGLNIQWQWNLEEGEDVYEDETGYYNHRDFKQLQLEMLQWLTTLARSFTEAEGHQYMVAFPLGYPRMCHDYFAVSPMQVWTKEWFDHVAATDVEGLEKEGAEFFIWWNKEADAHFYKRTGIALLNVECPWHFPADEKETKTFANIDQCFSMARKLDPAIDLPQEDWNAVKKFLSNEETDIPDSGFGYKKYLMTFDLAGQWMIDLPGNFYYNVDDGTEVYYDHERTVRNTGYTKHAKNSDEEFVATFFEDNQNAGAEQLDSDVNNRGTAILYYTIDQEAGEEYWILQGVKVMAGGFLLSTICYPTEEYRQWAVDTWNSVRKVK